MYSRNRRRALAAALILAALSACSSPNLQPVQLRATENYQYRQDQSGLRIAIDPGEGDAFKAASGLASEGVLALHVIVQNNTQSEIMASSRSMRLAWSEGQNLSPTPATAVFEQMKGSVVAGALLGGLIAAAAISSSNEAILTELTHREFKDGAIGPSQTHTGFLYFVPPEGVKIDSADFEASVLNVTSKEMARFKIAVPGMALASVKVRQPAGPVGCANCQTGDPLKADSAAQPPKPAPAATAPAAAPVSAKPAAATPNTSATTETSNRRHGPAHCINCQD
jgi:hypothetical protein